MFLHVKRQAHPSSTLLLPFDFYTTTYLVPTWYHALNHLAKLAVNLNWKPSFPSTSQSTILCCFPANSLTIPFFVLRAIRMTIIKQLHPIPPPL
jgi:hypothetical protein